MLRHKVILDTDIGDDIDDALALAFALNSPELELLGVTTVWTQPQKRARIARHLLDAYGKWDVPVHCGLGASLCPTGVAPFGTEIDFTKNPIQYAEHEMDGVRVDATTDAADFIIETARRHCGQVALVAIGPLTNIAVAFIRCPELKDLLARVVLMGGSYFGGIAEWNIVCDSEAARVVFESGVPLWAVGTDVTLPCRLDDEQTRALLELADEGASGKTPSGLVARWMMHGHDRPYLHDPLTVACVFLPDLLGFTECRIDVELNGRFTRGVTHNTTRTLWWSQNKPKPNAFVASTIDTKRMLDIFMDRIRGGK